MPVSIGKSTVNRAAWRVLIGLFCVLMSVALVSALTHGLLAGLLCLGSALTLFVLVWPIILRRQYDLFEPLSFVMLSVVVGVTLKLPYIVWTDDSEALRHLMLGRNFDILIEPMALFLLGLFGLALGYVAGRSRLPLERYPVFRNTRWDSRRLFWLSIVMLAVSVFCISEFVARMGVSFKGAALAELSGKRFLKIEGSQYAGALGYFRWGASLSVTVFIVNFTNLLIFRRKPSLANLGVVVIAALVSVSFAVFTSSRTDAAAVILVAIIIGYYALRRIPMGRVLVGILVTVALISLITALRSTRVTEQIQKKGVVEQIVDVTVGGRHFMDITKAAHVLDATPDKLEYQFGATFGTWVAAPIPRTYWPEKPVLGLGKLVGHEVFGFEYAGVPPGYLAELYMNFGVFGIFPGMLLFGCALSFLYRSVRPGLKARNPNVLLFYASVVVPISYGILGSDVSKIIIGLATELIPLFLILVLIQKTGDRHRYHRVDT